MPLFSVVIVTKCERLKDLQNCLTALADQSFRDFETVVVVPKNVNPPFKNTPNLNMRVIPQDGAGICNARNRGIKASKGDIIAFTDDDSEPCSNWLEKMKQHFDEHPDLDYLGGEFTMQPRNIWQRWINTRYHLSKQNIQAGLCHGNNMAYRKKVFLKALFDELASVPLEAWRIIQRKLYTEKMIRYCQNRVKTFAWKTLIKKREVKG